ncbi:MAG TPA: DUF6763 family protein [Gammaproteobacteria bacterium]|nr:DUF6763 family protein [Gammaproteobacteria bacterium]
MATEHEPRIGDWYRNASDEAFEIVAFDETDETVEIQYFDGTLEELDLDTWYELDIEPTAAPEDWSGSLDIEREDYGVDLDEKLLAKRNNPLDDLDQ